MTHLLDIVIPSVGIVLLASDFILPDWIGHPMEVF